MINLWYEDGHYSGRMSGPEKVILNLKASLDLQLIPYAVNENKYEKNLLLHYDANGHLKHEKLEHESCFIGPQFWPFDTYSKFLFENPSYWNKLITPSQWVKDLVVDKFSVEDSKVSVWPIGIEQTILNRNVRYDCLVYFKRRSQSELSIVEKFLSERKLSYNVITYGNYSESDLELLASQSRFCFMLNGTESQGIAVQEIMSANTPLFVWDVSEWNDQGQEYSVKATSIPYWDETCGEKFYDKGEMKETFDKFYAKIGEYRPKDFVEKNLSFKSSVKILLEILNAN
jgi:hypothetical protein